jgi:hypothetical protein
VTIYAVAASHRGDLEKIRRSTVALGLPKDQIVVVANGENPPTQEEVPAATVVTYPNDGFSLTNWWNAGIDWVYERATDPFEVFVFNADCYTDLHALETLSRTLRQHGLAIVCPDQAGVLRPGQLHVETRLVPVGNKALRLWGCAFMLNGDKRLRCDPAFRFYYNDDDIEWQGRQVGGVGIVGGVRMDHPMGGTLSAIMSPELHRFAAEDREKFRNKWGSYPH